MLFLTLLPLLTVTSANLLSQRANSPVDGDKMRLFTSQFRQTLTHLIADKWNETRPLVEMLRSERSICESRFAETEASCQSCAKSKCTPKEDDLIDVLLKTAEEMFKKYVFGEIVGLLGFTEITDFFEGIGKKFLDLPVVGKLGDFLEDLGKGLVKWDGWKDIGDSFEDLGKGILDIGEDIGKGLKHFGGQVEDTVKDLGKGLEDGIKDIGKGLEDGVKGLGKGLEDGIKGIGKGIENGIKDIGKTVHKIFVPRIRFRFRRIFGKKKKRSVEYLPESEDIEAESSSDEAEYALYRRSIEPEVRQCMERCSVCGPFLQDDATERTRSVCGNTFVELSTSDTIMTVVPKLQALYKRVTDDDNLIVSSLECDLSSYSFSNNAFSRAYINVFFENGYQTYQSVHPFNAGEIPTSAALMAKEYWDLFMEA